MSGPSTTESAAPAAPASGPDLTQAVWQLRATVCGLAAMVLVLSVAFNLFVWKQNRNLVAMANGRKRQISQLDGRVKNLSKMVGDLALYSEGHPELLGVFSRYGIELRHGTNAPSAKP